MGNAHRTCPAPTQSKPATSSRRNISIQYYIFFSFFSYLYPDGQRWFPWLPTIQVVSERRGGQQFPVVRGPPQEAIQRVQEVFPHIPPQVIAFDLMQTHSVELTIENFIEGRIPNVPNVK